MKNKKRVLNFITSNEGKFREVSEFFDGKGIALRQVKLDLLEIQETDAAKIIRHKVGEAKKTGLRDFVLEDTSLYIDGMGSLPGPLIKWFEKEIGNKGIYALASKMGDRSASSETVFAYCDQRGKTSYFRGVTRGKIVAPRGARDFGTGPVFKPQGSRRTFAQMSFLEKRPWSMRVKALKKLEAFLSE